MLFMLFAKYLVYLHFLKKISDAFTIFAKNICCIYAFCNLISCCCRVDNNEEGTRRWDRMESTSMKFKMRSVHLIYRI